MDLVLRWMSQAGHFQLSGLASGETIARFLGHGEVKAGEIATLIFWPALSTLPTCPIYSFLVVNRKAFYRQTKNLLLNCRRITSDMSFILALEVMTGTNGTSNCLL